MSNFWGLFFHVFMDKNLIFRFSLDSQQKKGQNIKIFFGLKLAFKG